ncbi:protein kinase domain-containing protein [Actinoplanes sp. CA-252034]|uniref:serine/threonine-protein kinase n=1 Tax=Actinoplanes sp. CA-252034 TaxID=3239906 RepID=UPI003D983A6E
MSGGATRVVGGRYRLSGWLGRGGMGAVWEAHDTLLGRDVALKEIYSPDDGAGPDDPMIRRAFREARAAARLRHRGIVTVHDVVTEDGRPWIVMELIDGPSLAAAVRAEGTLPERRAADIGLQVVDALHAAHRQGVLHRDVKPANILLDADRVVLTDFGIAAIDDATSITSTGQMIGSPAFLAPERYDGQPASAATDLWALGVTLYIAVTGRSPFPGDDLPGTLAAILHRSPEPPARAGSLWPVIEGLLAKDPARRLTADQAQTMLTAIVRDHGERPKAASARDGEHPQTATLRADESPLPATVRDGERPQTATIRDDERPQTATAHNDERPQTATVRDGEGPQAATLRDDERPLTDPALTTPPEDRTTVTVPQVSEAPAGSGQQPTRETGAAGAGATGAPGDTGPAIGADPDAGRLPAGPRRPADAGNPAPWPHRDAGIDASRPFPWHVLWTMVLVVSTLIAAGAVVRTAWLEGGRSSTPIVGTGSATPSSSPSPSKPPGAIPAAFVGEWSGTAKQPIGTVSSWEVTITFTATSSTGGFDTSLGCNGTLTVVTPWPTEREIHLRQETGWNPRGTCVDAADITLRIDADGRMQMSWHDLGEPLNVATASLTRS